MKKEERISQTEQEERIAQMELLMERADINLTTAVLLDAVQKKKPLSDQAIALLRKQKLVEGRKPNIHKGIVPGAVYSISSFTTKPRSASDNCLRPLFLPPTSKVLP